MTYNMGSPLDEGELYLGAVEVVEYLAPDGARGYRVRTDGDIAMSTALGLLRMAEHQLLAGWTPDRVDTDEG